MGLPLKFWKTRTKLKKKRKTHFRCFISNADLMRILIRNWWKVQRWPNPHSCQRYNLESRYEFIRIHLQINPVNNARLPKHPLSAAALQGLAQFPGLVFLSDSVPPYGWVTGNLASAANGRESWITQRLAREIRGFAKQTARRSLTGSSPRHIQIPLDSWLATGFGLLWV